MRRGNEHQKDYNFRKGGQAERLCGDGKAVMPAVMKRLPELPGKHPNARREHATRIALQILVRPD